MWSRLKGLEEVEVGVRPSLPIYECHPILPGDPIGHLKLASRDVQTAEKSLSLILKRLWERGLWSLRVSYLTLACYLEGVQLVADLQMKSASINYWLYTQHRHANKSYEVKYEALEVEHTNLKNN